MNRSILCLTAIALATTLCACPKKDDGAATAASASANAATTAAPSASAAAKKAKATLKLADVKAAYKTEMESTAKMRDPMDKKVAAFIAKVGAPPSTDTGRKKTWYVLDGANCSKVELDTKDGSLMDQSTDKGDCGL